MTTIGCFHAHYSNIEHIEKALAAYEVELVHFVDPGLDRMTKDADFNNDTAEQKVIETMDWISKCHVDAILITCTFFTAVLQKELLNRYSIPIFKLEEPLFHDICGIKKPVILVFTNPNTVEGTLQQLKYYSAVIGKGIQVEAQLLDHTFELIMQGRKQEYIAAVTGGLSRIAAEHSDHHIVAAQLSMVPAAEQVELLTGRCIGNSLAALAGHLERNLSLKHRTCADL
jgi:hypothetical protein